MAKGSRLLAVVLGLVVLAGCTVDQGTADDPMMLQPDTNYYLTVGPSGSSYYGIESAITLLVFYDQRDDLSIAWCLTDEPDLIESSPDSGLCTRSGITESLTSSSIDAELAEALWLLRIDDLSGEGTRFELKISSP